MKQRPQPLADHTRIGYQLVPRQHFIGGEPEHGRFELRAFTSEEKSEVAGELISRVFVGRDADERHLEMLVKA
jgi:hypothetical protein